VTLRRAVFLALLVVPISAAPVAAQLQPPPDQMPPCVKQFIKLRTDAETKGKAIKAAEGKVNAQGACKLFNAYAAAEAKMVEFAAANNVWCGIPPEAIVSMKKVHARTTEVRTRVCQAAAAGPPRPAGPSLSDALGGPVPASSNIKTGHGTFDTLTGSPIGNK